MFWKVSLIVMFAFVQFSYASTGEKQIRIIGPDNGSAVDGDSVGLDLIILDSKGLSKNNLPVYRLLYFF